MNIASSSAAARLLRSVGWEAALYLFALALLSIQHWGPGDVVWSLWSTSLITGFITLLVSMTARARATLAGSDGGIGLPLILLAGGLFTMAFFSVHFGMFHAVHSVFLNLFFPLVNWAGPEPGLVVQVQAYLLQCLSLYPAFIGLCVLSHVPAWLNPNTKRKAMMAPYANVVKLHLIIIAVGFSQALGAQYVAMIVFLGVYFLPLGAIFKALREATGKRGTAMEQT